MNAAVNVPLADGQPLPSLPPLTSAQVAGLDDPELLRQCVLDQVPGSSLRRIGLGLSGMYCAACSITIEDALRGVPGVSDVQVQAASQRARITLDPSAVRLSDLVAAVQRVGYKAWPDAAARAGHERLKERRLLLWQFAVAAFCMMQVMMITFPQYVAGRDEIPPDLWNLMNWANWVLSLPVVLFSCGPFFRGAWRAAMQGRVAMDTPVAIGMAAAFIVSTGVTFGYDEVFGPDAYFDSLTMFVAFLLAGRWLESRARERVTQSLEALCVRLPEAVDRAVDPAAALAQAETESVPVSALRHGDRVRVAAGQAFPADGQVLEGRTEVDESLLTGESRAVVREPGQMVVAGSINLSAPVWVSVERLGPDTRYQQIVSLVQQAMTEKPSWMRVADRFASPFLWGVLVLAALGGLVWYWIDPSKAIWVAVSVLVVTCPCAFSLSAPSALLAAAGNMATRGVLVRRLDALETLAHIDEVYFDKTGTLTEGMLTLKAVTTADGGEMPLAPDGSDWRTRWPQAADLAAHSQHPLSRSLVAAAEGEGGWARQAWDEVHELAGQGVTAQAADGRTWRLGRRDWVLAGHGPAWALAAERPRVWLAAHRPDGSLDEATMVGFVFDEVFRPQAAPALAELAAQGIRSAILSGDQRDRVEAAARELGQVAVAGAEATPEDKLRLIEQAQARGKLVAVVGDGINDAPVLAKANVSIALDQGAALAQSQSDLLVLNGRLSGVPQAVSISQRALRIVKQNLTWSAIYNFSSIPLALVGLMPPWLAGLGMALSSLGVVLNALRLGAARH
jgi:Cu2+-exporting ATPase